jgi:hypothetical protein
MPSIKDVVVTEIQINNNPGSIREGIQQEDINHIAIEEEGCISTMYQPDEYTGCY